MKLLEMFDQKKSNWYGVSLRVTTRQTCNVPQKSSAMAAIYGVLPFLNGATFRGISGQTHGVTDHLPILKGLN